MEGANLLNSEKSLVSTTLLWGLGWLFLELGTCVLERAPCDGFVTSLASLTGAIVLHMHLRSLPFPVWTFCLSSATPATTKELRLGPTRHKLLFLLLKSIEPGLQVMLIEDDVLTIFVVGHICCYRRNLTRRSASFRIIVIIDFVKSYRVPRRIPQETIRRLLACYSFESRRSPFLREGGSRSNTREIIDNHLRLLTQSWSSFH